VKIPRRIFIGYDSTTPEPYFVCRQSMIDLGVDPKIIYPLILELFEGAGWYWRDDSAKRSTEFTNSRFLVPYLSGFYGQSIFCDNDFLWRKSPEILFDLMEAEPHHAVRVVQHHLQPEELTAVKMDGKPQSWYPKKNWSSMMVFNNAHEDCRKLIPERINDSEIDWLHQFKWTSDAASLPLTFNYLVGYGYGVKDPYAVHFTNGGPWLEQFRNVEYAEEWFNVQRKTERIMY
jgi:hypothetical protein